MRQHSVNQGFQHSTNTKTILAFYVATFIVQKSMHFFLDIHSKHPYNWDHNDDLSRSSKNNVRENQSMKNATKKAVKKAPAKKKAAAKKKK